MRGKVSFRLREMETDRDLPVCPRFAPEQANSLSTLHELTPDVGRPTRCPFCDRGADSLIY